MTQVNLLNKHNLCLEEDAFLSDKTIWIAHLSNGITVYQDDDRPNIQEASAWKRLASYITETACLQPRPWGPPVSIIGMKLKFRSHIIELPPNAPGYYFSHGLSKTAGDTVTRGYFVCGALDNDIGTFKHLKVFTGPQPDVFASAMDVSSSIDSPSLLWMTCKWFNIPELTISREERRPLSELREPFLILNPT